jgi:hypothetical protein
MLPVCNMPTQNQANVTFSLSPQCASASIFIFDQMPEIMQLMEAKNVHCTVF